MTRFIHRAAILLAVGTVLATNNFDPADQKVVDDARDKLNEYCGLMDEVAAIDYEKGRQNLYTGAGGEDNPLFKLLTESDGPDDLGQTAGEVLNPVSLVGKGWPIVLSIILWIVYAFCCWSACCPCCRCCKKQREVSRLCKGIYAIIFAVLAFGLLITTFLAVSGFNGVDTGMVTTGCSSAKLLDDMLAGDKKLNFIGLLPVVKTFESLLDSLQTNPRSPFLTSITTILDKTKVIDDAVVLTGSALTLLTDMLLAPENLKPTVSGSPGYHTCMFCEEVGGLLAPIAADVTEGVGSALAAARKEVDTQLDGPNLANLRLTFDKAIEPLRVFKQTAVESIGWFVKPGGFDGFVAYVRGTGSALFFLVLYASFVFFLILLCGCCSLGAWCCRHKNESAEPGSNPYRTSAWFLPCCTWCNAMIYAMNVLLVGGLMVLISFVGSGVCLVLLDFDEALGKDIFKGLGIDPSPEFDQAIKAADRCLSLKSAPIHDANNVSRNLLEIIKIDSPSSPGTSVTVHQEVVVQAIDPVNDQFDQLSAALSSKPQKLSDQNELVKIRGLLSNYSVDGMILPDLQAARGTSWEAKFVAMGSDSKTKVGLATSLSCADSSPGPDFGQSQAIPGMQSFYDSYKSMGVGVPGGTCATRTQKVATCSDPTDAACAAANEFMDLKYNLQANAVFRCDLFQNPSNSLAYCDPKDATKVNDVWQNTCLDSQGKLTVKQRDCNLDEFNTYVMEFDARLEKVFLILDETVEKSLTDVNIDLFNLVDTEIIKPIYDVVNGFNCQFMLEFWEGLIDGVCFQGMNGFRLISNSYVISAVLCLGLAILMYFIWRANKDNVDTWQAADSTQY